MRLVTPELWYRLFWVLMAIGVFVALHFVVVRPIVKAIREGRQVSMHERQIEALLIDVLRLQVYAARRSERIERKIDALGSGMTTEEVKAAVLQLNADAKQVEDANTALAIVAEKLKDTGV